MFYPIILATDVSIKSWRLSDIRSVVFIAPVKLFITLNSAIGLLHSAISQQTTLQIFQSRYLNQVNQLASRLNTSRVVQDKHTLLLLEYRPSPTLITQKNCFIKSNTTLQTTFMKQFSVQQVKDVILRIKDRYGRHCED